MSAEKHPRPRYRLELPPRPAPPERRKTPRLEECPPLFVTGLRATVHDISRTGISLNVAEPVATGRRYRLVLRDALDFSEQPMEAEAVWCSGERAGFRWVDLNPEQDGWLRRHFQSWLATCLGASRR
jgi:hypothetical protein